MPTLKLSINIDPNEPRTFWKIPITFAILVVQILIFLFPIALAVGNNHPGFLIFSAAQGVASVFFLFNCFYFILAHLALQLFGLFWMVGLILAFLLDLNIQPDRHRLNVNLWIFWFLTIVYVYYLNLVFEHVKYLWKQRKAASTQSSATAPNEESVKLCTTNNDV